MFQYKFLMLTIGFIFIFCVELNLTLAVKLNLTFSMKWRMCVTDLNLIISGQ